MAANDGSNIGKLTRVPLREVWPHEALDVLNEHLPVALTSADREQSAGAFSVDLVAEDADGNTVVIENQLERSNHDHLGKLITYLAAFEAKRAIWIVAEPRPEHVRAISWLNDASSADFHLFRVEAIQIGDSAPAPLLSPIVGPSENGSAVAETRRELKQRHHSRLEFWQELLTKSRDRTKLFSGVSAGTHPYISTGAGMGGLSYQYWVRQHDSFVQFWIDRGKDNADQNEALFDQLLTQKEAIEATFGGKLTWDRLESNRAFKVVGPSVVGGWKDDPESWGTTIDQLIDDMTRFHAALATHVQGLRTT